MGKPDVAPRWCKFGERLARRDRYNGSSAACHGGDLGATLVGDAGASPLRSEAFGSFIEGWEARRLFGEIKTTMPADNPSKQSDDLPGHSGVGVLRPSIPVHSSLAEQRQ